MVRCFISFSFQFLKENNLIYDFRLLTMMKSSGAPAGTLNLMLSDCRKTFLPSQDLQVDLNILPRPPQTLQ
jgi:hypothetical protein